MNSKLTEKYYLFDNLKALMLFLVVIGHILDPYIERQNLTPVSHAVYLSVSYAHVCFITGYHQKHGESQKQRG